jgi:C4-dicarboxylate-specific signal transduction histidine kinase
MQSFDELTLLLDEAAQDPEPAVACDLARMVDELFNLLVHQSSMNHLALNNLIERKLSVTAPEIALRHALMKLLQNAIEAQRDKSAGSVSVSAEQARGRVEILVEDAGPGFKREALEQFQRADSIARYSGRTSGLSIVQRFCEGVGGEPATLQLTRGRSARLHDSTSGGETPYLMHY